MGFVTILASILLIPPLVAAGTSCPHFDSILPCYCSATQDRTTMICPNIQNSSQLEMATSAMKSMIIDRFMLLGGFTGNQSVSEEKEEVEVNAGERLPESWLASSRVREVEIQDMKMLSNCFLCDNPFEGQDDFLTSLMVTHSSLEGHLCSVCNTKIKSVSTRFLQRMKSLQNLDFSYNDIGIISGNAFPVTLEKLEKINLSHNKLIKIYDNAFTNLSHLEELDLSNNKLISISRKIFRSTDNSLSTLDLSWNSIKHLPDDMFLNFKKLKEVKLSYNLLEVLSQTTFSKMPSLMEKIDVKGNFVTCNCTMSWIGKQLSKTTKIVGKCISPKEVEFQDIKQTLSSLQSCR